jgi:hypothetical protein
VCFRERGEGRLERPTARREPEVGVPFDVILADLPGDLVADVDVTFSATGTVAYVVPAFQSGDGSVRARFAPPHEGRFDYATSSLEPLLDGIRGNLEARPYGGENQLYKHGRIRVASSGRTLEHGDGSPFLWIGDTWWMGLGTRLRWPDEFGLLLADRVDKGFSLVQIVAGPLPDFSATPEGIWHPQQANEAGWPWDKDWARLNPHFFDRADLRIAALVDAGIVPCIVGMWGYYLTVMGTDRVRRHWRNLVARYAAFPVVFCVAGEVNHPGPSDGGDPTDRSARQLEQVATWGRMIHEVRRLDPFQNPVTAHPAHPDARRCLIDPSGLDINMIQTSHWSFHAPSPDESREMTEELGLSRPIRLGFQGAVALTAEAVAESPAMPVVNGEPSYEGIMGGNWQDVQRFLFWTGMLSGLAGFTYGADGIWQMASAREPFSSTVSRWGTSTWQEAMHYPGGRQVGLGRQILEQFKWWDLRPLDVPRASQANRLNPFAASTEDFALYYLPSGLLDDKLRGMRGLPIDVSTVGPSMARFIDPRTTRDYPIGPVEPDSDGVWRPPTPPSREDWLLVVESEPGRD